MKIVLDNVIETKWSEIKDKYVSGQVVFIGKVKVGAYFYDGMRPRGQEECYKAVCYLEGVKTNLGHFKKYEDAMERVEQAIVHWFSIIEAIK